MNSQNKKWPDEKDGDQEFYTILELVDEEEQPHSRKKNVRRLTISSNKLPLLNQFDPNTLPRPKPKENEEIPDANENSFSLNSSNNENENNQKVNAFKNSILKQISLQIPQKSQERNATTNVNININIIEPKSSNLYIISKPNSAKSDKSLEKLESRKISPRLEKRHSSPKPIQSNVNFYESPPRSPSKNWKKISNVIRSVNSLRKYNTKNIDNESEMDEDLQDYKERLFNNTIKVREAKNEQLESKTSNFSIKIHKDWEKSELRFNTKEEIQNLIINGGNDAMEKLDKLFRNNPDKYSLDNNDPNFMFNKPLSNGKTLLYIACQEGRYEVVKYLLEKKLIGQIKSRIDSETFESPLQCACRWNYVKIVNLLLEKVDFSKQELKEAISMKNLSESVKYVLKRHMIKKFKRVSYCC